MRAPRDPFGHYANAVLKPARRDHKNDVRSVEDCVSELSKQHRLADQFDVLAVGQREREPGDMEPLAAERAVSRFEPFD